MAGEKETRKRVSRRQFVKGAAVGAAGVAAGALSGCSPAATPGPAPTPQVIEKEVIKEVEVKPWLPEKWDQEADVVIIGSGGAGCAAAIEARDGGASVTVLEKMKDPGGTTKLSGGIFQASGTPFQKSQGIDDTPEAHFKYWMQASEGIADPELVKVMAYNSAGNLEWLESQGLKYISLSGVNPIPYITEPGLMVLRIHGLEGEEPGTSGRGDRMAKVLFEQAERKGATFLFETPAASLVYDPSKGVVGVRATQSGGDIYVKANKAVILAAGSFDFGKEMCKSFSPQQLWALETGTCSCSPGNVGDGIKMAMAVGADLASMGGTVGYFSPSIGYSDGLPGIWVNKHGLRFTNENGHYAYMMRAVFDQEEHMAWAIFDETVKQVGGTALGYSDDYSKEIAEGTVKTAPTLEALAQALGVNPKQLVATVAQWNADVAGGKDTLFNKTVGLKPIQAASFYAIQVTERNLGSNGGVRINANAQVIDVFGQVIARLYAAGMNAGGFLGPYYPGSGTALNSTVTFGRIAAKGAVAEKAWS